MVLNTTYIPWQTQTIWLFNTEVYTISTYDATYVYPLSSTWSSMSSYETTMFTVEIVILAIAIIGNSLTFCICMRKDNRRRSFMLYLAVLSISDTVNCSLLVLSYIIVNMDVSWGAPEVFCKVTVFIFRSAQYISSWLTVVISLERTVSTKLPHHVGRISSKRFGIKIISVLVVVIFILNCHIIYGYSGIAEGSMITCTVIRGPYEVIEEHFQPIVHALVYSLIPGFLIILCNTVMVKAVFASARIRGTISDQAAKRNRELLIVTILISISFIILTGPGCLFTIFSGILHDEDANSRRNDVVLFVTIIMSYLNYGIIFFLYVISGSRFRQQLKELFLCKVCRKQIHVTTIMSELSR